MNSITTNNRLSVIVEEANRYIKDWLEIYLTYYPTVEDYHKDSFEEYAVEEVNEFYDSYPDVKKGFVLISGSGWTSDEEIVIPEEFIDTHESIIGEIDTKYILTEQHNRFP